MASNQVSESPDGDGTESKGNSKLDNLSREDLVKFVKKQMLLMQKSKSQCDALNQELTRTKAELKKLADSAPDEKDSDNDREKETLIQAYNASQNALEESATKIASLTEQMSCLQQKNETLTSLYQCMQSEYDSAASRYKELESSNAVLSEARDEAIRQLTAAKKQSENVSNTAQYVCPNCGEREGKLEELTSALTELQSRIKFLETVEQDRDQLKQDLGQTQEKLAKAAVVLDKLKKERLQLKEQHAEGQALQVSLMDLQQAFDRVKHDKDNADQEKLKALQELDRASSEAGTTRQQLEEVILERDELASQIETLQKTTLDIETQLKAALSEAETSSQQVKSLQGELLLAEQDSSALQEQISEKEASSCHFAKAFDDISLKYREVLDEKLEADDKLEQFFACLGSIGTDIKGESLIVNQLSDAKHLLISIKDEYFVIRKELEFQKETNKGINQELAELKDSKRTIGDDSLPSNGSNESSHTSREVEEYLLQIEALKAEVETQSKGEEELNSLNEELKLTIKQLESRLDQQISEKGFHRETSLPSNDDLPTLDGKSTEILKVDREFSRQSSEFSGESELNITERDVLLQEVMFSRGKLAEWETMMSMLQAGKDGLEREITKFGEREARSSDLLEEILRSLQDALKGKDLFQDESKMIEDNGVLYAKLCILQSNIDETIFERDEMREKIQHLSEQVAEMEKGISEPADNSKAQSNLAERELDGNCSEDRSVTDAEKKNCDKVTLERSTDDNQALKSSTYDEIVEALNAEIAELKQLLEIEKSESRKWKCSSDEKDGIAADLVVERDLMEKKFSEAREELDNFILNHKTDKPVADDLNNQDKKLVITDSPVENRDSADGILTKEFDLTATESEKLIMTEQLQMRTVRANDRCVIEVLSDEEKMHLLEENNNLKEEILLLKQQLSSGKYDSLGLTVQMETPVVQEETHILETNLTNVSLVQHKDEQAHQGSLEEKSGELGETGNGDGQSDRGSTVAVEMEQLLEECRQLRKRLDVQDLELKEKNSEIEKLNSMQSWGWGDTEALDTEKQMEKMQEEFMKNRKELEATITEKNEEIQRLTTALNDVSEEKSKLYDGETSKLRSELSRIQTEMESLGNNKDAKIETLESDLRKNQEEKANIEAQVKALNSELTRIKEDETSLVTSLRADLEDLEKQVCKLREENDKKDIAAHDAVSVIKADFAKAMNENTITINEKEKLIEALQLELTHLKESSSNEVINLENNFSRVKEDFESMMSVKETQLKELREKLVLSEEVKDLVRMKEVEIETRKEEVLAVKEEAEKQMKQKDSVIEQLEKEISRVREILEKNAQEEMENLKAESIESKKLLLSQIENSEQECRRLEERIDSINDEHSISMKEKNGEILRLISELNQYKEKTENITTAKDNEMETLREEIARLKTAEHEVDDKLEEIEQLKAKLITANEENEKVRTEKEREIAELCNALENSKAQIADLISCGKTESEKLQSSHDCELAERDKMLQSKEAKVKELEKCIQQLQAVIVKNSESDLKFMSLEKEYEAVKVTVNDKENEIERLKDEMTALKNQLDTSFDRKDEPTETQPEKTQIQMSPSAISSDETLAALQQQLKDREERENKLKQLTLKSKRESADLKAKLLSCQKDLEVTRSKLAEANSTGASNRSVQFQSLQTEYEDLESRFEVEKSSRQELEKNLMKAIEELTNTKVTSAELAEENSKISWELQKLEREKKELETKCTELEQEHCAERIQREQMTKNHAEMESKLLSAEAHLKELEAESKVEVRLLQDQIKTANQELSLAKTEIQQSNMMDLEIADYERAVKSLNETVAERNAKIKSLQEDIDRQQEQKTAMQKLLDSSTSQYTQLDDHCNKLKQLLVKSKKDLAEAKKLESEQRTSDAHLRGQLERLTQLTEEQKLQNSLLTAENQRQADKLRLHSDTHQRTAQSLELRVQTLEQDLQLARSELSSVQTDYDGYKVRVHSVLKHQKTKSGVGEDLSLEQERSERQHLEKMVDSLKVKLADLSHQKSSMSSEYDQLQEEHDRLQTRNTRLITEMETSERNWRDRLEKISAESSLNSRQKAEAVQQCMLQSETISTNYKEQIRSIQEEHHRVVQSLRQQLEATEIELDRYRARLQAANQNPSGNSSAAALHLPDHEPSPDRVLDFVKELRPEERQSGEGSENIEDIHAKTMPVANQGLLPFEQLLDSSQMDDVISVRTMESTAEEMALKSSLTSAEKRIEHLTQILNESEATVLRLTEQASILKGEIRRMERNQEREKAISNLEYLKNIVYKFLTLKSGDERLQLIPVLTTMLKLSPDEKDKMTAIATGAEGVPPTGQDPSGWGAYLHRWSGLV